MADLVGGDVPDIVGAVSAKPDPSPSASMPHPMLVFIWRSASTISFVARLYQTVVTAIAFLSPIAAK